MSDPRVQSGIRLRPANMRDLDMLEHWESQPHVQAATHDGPEEERETWNWSDQLGLDSDWRQLLIAEFDGRSIGFVQIIDPHLEEEHYWGEIEPNLRAIDIWLGEGADLGKGYGEAIMKIVIERCFAAPDVTAIVIDPLASNAASHRFYQRLGFVPEGVRRFASGDDCLVHRLTRADWRANTSRNTTQGD